MLAATTTGPMPVFAKGAACPGPVDPSSDAKCVWQQQSPSKASHASSYDSFSRFPVSSHCFVPVARSAEASEDEELEDGWECKENLQRAGYTCTSRETGQAAGGRGELLCSEDLGKAPEQPATPRPGGPATACKARACTLADLQAMIRNEQERELELAPDSRYLECHGSENSPEGFITPQMRMIVTSWMCEVAAEFRLQQETLFLAVTLLDRFLSVSKAVPRTALQLVAVACMLLASKQEEVVHPSVEELTDISANCFSKGDLLRMEMILLDSFSWRIKSPTPYSLLHLLCQALQAQLPAVTTATAAYLTELSLLDYSMLAFPPSAISAAAVLLAQATHGTPLAWEQVSELIGYSTHELHSCMAALLQLQHLAAVAHTDEPHQPLVFVRSKYSSPAWLGVAANVALLQSVPKPPTSPSSLSAPPASIARPMEPEAMVQ